MNPRRDPRRAARRFPRWMEGVRRFLTQDVWSMDLGGMPTFRAIFYKISRVLYLALRGFIEDRCLFRASALAYITVLSLVPLLAFAFSVAKGLGAYDTLMAGTIEPFLDRTIGVVAEEGSLEGDVDGPARELASAGEALEATGAEAAPVDDEGATSEVLGEPSSPEEGESDEPQVAEVLPTSELRIAVDKVLQFVAKTNVGSLGFFGLAFLAYTVVKLLSTIERSFNDIWGIKKARSIVRKVSDYLSMVVVVPIFLATATAATTAIQSARLTGFLDQSLGLGPVREFFFRLLPLISMWIGFAFVYLFMPNTRTRVKSALIGGVTGGTLWYLAQILHVRFQVGMANYNAIYSGFAAFPIFLLWIYVSWVTVLFGAEFAFAHQNEPAYRQIARSRHHDQAFKEVLAIRAVVRIAVRFLSGGEPYRSEELAESLGVPERSVDEVLELMQDQRIVAATEEGFDSGVLPARDLDNIRVKNILDALKGTTGPVDFPPRAQFDEEIDSLLTRFEAEQFESPHNASLRQLADQALAQEAEGHREAGPGVSSDAADAGTSGDGELAAL